MRVVERGTGSAAKAAPLGWIVAPLKTVVTLRSERVNPRSFPDLSYIGMEHVEPHTNRIIRTLPASAVTSSSAGFWANDVLYGRMRPYLNKVAQPRFAGLASAEFMVFASCEHLHSSYLRMRLTSPDFVEFALGQISGDRPRVKFEQLGDFEFALPPLREQHRIVEKLEELLSDLDAGVAELRAAQAKLKLYRQSSLKAAVTGELTAEWRKQVGATGERDHCGEGGLPSGWARVRIGDMARVGTGVTPLRSRADYFEGGTLPWVTSGALNADVVRNASELLTPVALNECRLQVFPPGTLLVAMYGEGKTRGKCSELGISAAINQAIAAIVLHPDAVDIKRYLKIFLLYSYAKMREQASGGVQPNLNLQIIKNIEVPLPPPDEQLVIAEVLDDLLENVAEQGTAITLALRQSEAQRKNILQAAFSGQLVPQDPDDEPASVLLERIRASRGGKATTTTRRPRKAKEPA